MAGGLRGFVGQGMDARKPRTPQVEPYTFPPGTYSFNVPYPGLWKFVGWGKGGDGGSGNYGASGSYVEFSRQVTPNQTVTIVVGGESAPNTTITFSDGTVVTAGGAAGTIPGTASGGDININGSAAEADGGGTGGGPSGAGKGAGAPANLPYRGAAGSVNQGQPPGAGGGGSPTSSIGGMGLVIVTLR